MIKYNKIIPIIQRSNPQSIYFRIIHFNHILDTFVEHCQFMRSFVRCVVKITHQLLYIFLLRVLEFFKSGGFLTVILRLFLTAYTQLINIFCHFWQRITKAPLYIFKTIFRTQFINFQIFWQCASQCIKMTPPQNCFVHKVLQTY